MLWLLDFKAFPPWAPPSASQVKFRCPLDGVKTPTAIVSLIHSYTHTHLHILIKRDNIRINIKVNLAPTYRPLIVFVEAKTIIYITKEPFLFAV